MFPLLWHFIVAFFTDEQKFRRWAIGLSGGASYVLGVHSADIAAYVGQPWIETYLTFICGGAVVGAGIASPSLVSSAALAARKKAGEP